MEKDKPSQGLLIIFELMLLAVVNLFKFAALLVTSFYRLWCPQSSNDKIEASKSPANFTKN